MYELCIQMLGRNDATLVVCFVELCADTIPNVSNGGPKNEPPTSSECKWILHPANKSLRSESTACRRRLLTCRTSFVYVQKRCCN